MSLLAIRRALEGRLATLAPAIDTQWENAQYRPTPGVPYQQVYFLPSDPDNPGFGAPHRRERGIMQITLRYPIGDGPKAAAERAEAIRAHFPRGLSVAAEGVTVLVWRSPAVGRGFTEGDRYGVTVSVPYLADVFA